MKTLKRNFTYLPLLLLLWFYRCEGLNDSSLPAIFYPFGSDEGDSVVRPGCSICTGPIFIPYTIFNSSIVYVCTPGLVSFGSALTSSSGSLPRTYGPPVIAANWQSYCTYSNNIYNKGRVYYRSTSSDVTLLAAVSRTVQQVFSRSFSNFQSRWVFVVTWHNVSSYSSSTARNNRYSFQLVVSTNGTDHFIILNYGSLYCLTCGTSGYDSRERGNYFRIPSSYRLSGTNTGLAGRWASHVNKVKRSTINVRLAGSGLRHEGRLEVRYNGIWGTVTDNSFSTAEAQVFCYTLGFGYNGQVLSNKYGPGTGRIWLDNVACTDCETSISQCRHRGWGVHNSTHAADVSISCYFDSTTEYAVRLVGGRNPDEGRLEILYNDTWGTVCDDVFSDNSAAVVCNMLGLRGVGRHYGQAYYGAGTGTIWLDNVRCRGTETDIAMCSRNRWGSHNCGHSEDVSVSCSVASSALDPLFTRLVRIQHAHREGRLEVYYNGAWGTVCGHSFTDTAAKVACNALGYGYVGHVLNNVHAPGTGKIWLDHVRCKGCERRIEQCSHNSWGYHNCDHRDDVSIACYDRTTTAATTSELTTATSTTTTTTTTIDTTLIIIVVVVVGGLLLIAVIVCIIVIVACWCCSRDREPQQARTDVSMISMPVTASTNSYSNNAFVGETGKANPATDPRGFNDSTYSDVHQPPAHFASTVHDGDDDYCEPLDTYESVPDNPQVPFSYPNRRQILNKARNSLMPT